MRRHFSYDRKRYTVEREVPAPKGQPAHGGKIKRVWIAIGTFDNQAVAERTQRNAMVDFPDSVVRIK